ncbi:hypothetical protein CEP54_007287 [Fusarium duplospermum]|uniref:Uncharacterized protein n=1 Tax=Fusarium duplospermum TaxID=1325734 RepID=A0A428Q280_9HYPO|nr:hypothetical protein CEP54_007287 [Fusarium duplospermum]
MGPPPPSRILVEAESFTHFGGWVLDSQFDLEMGSPYLMAPGQGRPVEDATTEIHIATAGDYKVWVRAKDWVPKHHPGRFTIKMNDMALDTEFVVGGGVTGIAAALTAARLGERVALIQDRPFLGGNASTEIGLRPRGITGPLINEIYQREASGDLYAKQLLDNEPNAIVFVEHTIFAANTKDFNIISVDARDARSGREVRLTAPIFINCSGRALFGQYSGAETQFGQESRAEYGEGLAPAENSQIHHGNIVFFRTRMEDSPVPCPPSPWATEVAKDFANLGGQLVKPGIENGEGPSVSTS